MNVTVLFALAALFAAPLAPQTRKKDVREVKAIGCVRKAVEGGCLLLTTLDGKTTYNIFAKPQPEPGIVITIEGKPHAGPTACMQGLPIDVTSWEETGEKCSK